MVETNYHIPGAPSLTLLTDSHNCSPSPILESLRRRRPQLILIAGDFTYGSVPTASSTPSTAPILKMQESTAAMDLITGCSAIAPTYISLGNHEWIDRPIVNCRVESAAEKPLWKDAWKSHRCIVPASYYFEWEHLVSPSGKPKTGDKYMIQPRGSEVCYLAGLYRLEEFRDLKYPVFTILTKTPSQELSRLHDRMPVILPAEMIDDWIRPDSNPAELVKDALTDMVFERAI